jgi:hypothetical protein
LEAVRFSASGGLYSLIDGALMTISLSKTDNGSSSRSALRALRNVCLGLAIAGLASSAAFADEDASADGAVASPQAQATPAALHKKPLKLANFDGAKALDDVRKMADWIVTSGDNRGMAFVIVEKPKAQVFAFDAKGNLLGSAPCLVGAAKGDDSVPGVGTMTLAQISPEMRTTPAGRFVSSLGPDLGKKDVLWVDYNNAISLHRMVNNVRSERRPERMASPDPLEHRISWGCINVPAKFFDHAIEPTFTGTSGVVYILPEVRSMHDVFPAYYDVTEHAEPQSADLPSSAPEQPTTISGQ